MYWNEGNNTVQIQYDEYLRRLYGDEQKETDKK